MHYNSKISLQAPHIIKTTFLSNRLRTKAQQIHRPPIRLDDKEQMDHKAQFVVGVCAG